MTIVDIRSLQVGNIIVPTQFDDSTGPVAPGSSITKLVDSIAFLSVTSDCGEVVGVEVTVVIDKPPTHQHPELVRFNDIGSKFILSKAVQKKVAVMTTFGLEILSQADTNLRTGPASRFGKGAPHSNLGDATGMFISPKVGGHLSRIRLDGFEVESRDGIIFSCSTKAAGQDRLVALAATVRVMNGPRLLALIKNLLFEGDHFRERLEYYAQEHGSLPAGHEMKSAGSLPHLVHLPIFQASHRGMFEEFVHLRFHAYNQEKLGWQDLAEGAWSPLKDESTMEGKKRIFGMVERFQEVAATVWNDSFGDVAASFCAAYRDRNYPLRRFHDGMTSVILWGVVATWAHDLHHALESSVSGTALSTPQLAKAALQKGFESSMAHMYAGTGPWIVSPSEDYYLHGGVAPRLVYRSTTRGKKPGKSSLKRAAATDAGSVSSTTSTVSGDRKKKRKKAKKSTEGTPRKERRVRLQDLDSGGEERRSDGSDDGSLSTDPSVLAERRKVVKNTARNAKPDKAKKGGPAPSKTARVCVFWLAHQLALKDELGVNITCHREDKGQTCFARHAADLKAITAKECLESTKVAKGISEDRRAAFKAGIELAEAAGSFQ